MITRNNLLAALVAVAAFAALAISGDRTLAGVLVALPPAMACGLMVALVKKRPVLAFAALLVLASLSRLTIATPVGRVRLEEPPMLVAIAMILATRTWPRWSQVRRLAPIAIALGIYLAVLTLSSVLESPDLKISARMIIWTTLSIACGAVTFALLVRVEARPSGDEAPAGNWLTLTGVFHATVGVIVALGFVLFGPWDIPGVQTSVFEVPKVAAFGWEANLYASTLGALAPFAVERFRRRRDRLSAGLVLLILIGFGLGVTRGAYIGLACGLAAYLGLLAWRRIPTRVVANLVPLLLAGFLLAPVASAVLLPDPGFAGLVAKAAQVVLPSQPPAAQTTAGQTPAGQTPAATRTFGPTTGADTLEFRISHVGPAYEEFLGSPIIGLGAATYGQRHVLTGGNEGQSDYLGMLVLWAPYEAGVAGAAALFIGLLLALRLLYLASAIDLGAMACFLGSIVSMLVAYETTNGLFMGLFWVILGAGLASAVRAFERAGPTTA